MLFSMLHAGNALLHLIDVACGRTKSVIGTKNHGAARLEGGFSHLYTRKKMFLADGDHRGEWTVGSVLEGVPWS